MTKNFRNFYFALGTVALGAVGLTTLASSGDSTLLSQVPKAGTSQLVPKQQTSTVKAQVVVPFAKLNEVANTAAPSTFSKGGRERPCRRIGPRGDLPFGGSYDLTTNVCMNVDYNVNVRRGDVTIVPGVQPGSLRVAVPIHFDGAAGFSGDLARLLALHRKSFNGAVQAWVDLQADVGGDWCPKLTGRAAYSWITPARVEIVQGVWLPVANLLDGELSSRLDSLTNALQGAVGCQTVRDEAAKAWSVRSVPLPVFNGVQAHLNIEPVSVGFSGLQVLADRLELAFQAQAKVAVSDAPVEQRPMSLPPLQRIENEPGRIQVALPLQLAYEPLTRALNGTLKDKIFASDTPAGRVKVKLRGLHVYPSGEDLVVGMSFEADVPGRWLDVSGEVFLYGRPTLDAAGQVVSIKDLRFSRIVDNDLWSLLSMVFESDVRKAIASQARFDLAPSFNSAKEMLGQQLREMHRREGVSIDLGRPRIAVGQIVPADNALVVEALFESDAVLRVSNESATH
jgi:hypothetical protein